MFSAYAALVIFREDEAILRRYRQTMGRTGWAWDGQTSSDIIDDLASRALLQVNTGNPRTIVLHGLLRSHGGRA